MRKFVFDGYACAAGGCSRMGATRLPRPPARRRLPPLPWWRRRSASPLRDAFEAEYPGITLVHTENLRGWRAARARASGGKITADVARDRLHLWFSTTSFLSRQPGDAPGASGPRTCMLLDILDPKQDRLKGFVYLTDIPEYNGRFLWPDDQACGSSPNDRVRCCQRRVAISPESTSSPSAARFWLRAARTLSQLLVRGPWPEPSG